MTDPLIRKEGWKVINGSSMCMQNLCRVWGFNLKFLSPLGFALYCSERVRNCVLISDILNSLPDIIMCHHFGQSIAISAGDFKSSSLLWKKDFFCLKFYPSCEICLDMIKNCLCAGNVVLKEQLVSTQHHHTFFSLPPIIWFLLNSVYFCCLVQTWWHQP